MARRATNIPPGIRPAPGPHGTTVYKIRIRHNRKLERCGTYTSLESARDTLKIIRKEQTLGTFDPANYQARGESRRQTDPSPLFPKVIDDYLSDQIHLAPSSYDTYKTACAKIKAALDGIPWSEVTRDMIKRLVLSVQKADNLKRLQERRDDDEDLEDLIEEIAQQEVAAVGKTGRPKDSGGGVETLVNVLRNVYSYGIANGLPVPPVDPLYRIHDFIAEREPFLIRPYTETEMHHYLDNLSKAERWFKTWSYLAFGTGGRLGETVALVDSCLNFHDDEIKIWRQYHKGLIRPPKFDSVRTVPMASDVRDVLLEWLEQIRWERKFQGRESEPFHWILPSWKNPKNYPLSPSFVANYHEEYLIRIGLTPRRVHDIRHTVATRLAREGKRPDVIKAIMGHRDITTTLKYYVHVSTEEHRQAMETLLTRRDRPTCPTCKRPLTGIHSAAIVPDLGLPPAC